MRPQVDGGFGAVAAQQRPLGARSAKMREGSEPIGRILCTGRPVWRSFVWAAHCCAARAANPHAQGGPPCAARVGRSRAYSALLRVGFGLPPAPTRVPTPALSPSRTPTRSPAPITAPWDYSVLPPTAPVPSRASSVLGKRKLDLFPDTITVRTPRESPIPGPSNLPEIPGMCLLLLLSCPNWS